MSDVGLSATLQLEISDALARIDQLSAKLSEATTGIPVVLGDADTTAVTQSIDQAVGAADAVVPVEADADAVTPAIDSAVDAADAVVPVDADVGSAEAALGALGAEADSLAATVPVDADVSAADAAIADVAALADGTEATISISADSSQVEELTGSLESLKGATSGATGLAAGLGSAIGGINPEAAAAVAAVGALVEVTHGLFESGVDAIAAEQRLAIATGAFAGQVDKIHVGTLNTDIEGLAKATGSTVPPLENAISRIFTLGTTSGESGKSITATSGRILALAGDLRVTNPALGETGEIADRLTNALARGGRATQAFGISLSANQIAQEALIETGKSSANQLTQYEKAAAGAKLATDQLGASFKDNFAAGQNNPVIQIGQIKAEFVTLFEELGKPLVAPVIDLLRDLVPLGKDVGTLLGLVVEAVLPLATALADVLAPPLHLVATILELIPPSALQIVGGLALATAGFYSLALAVAAVEATNPALAALAVTVGLISAAVGTYRALTGAAQADHLRDAVEAETQALTDQNGMLQITSKTLDDYVKARDAAGKSDFAAKFKIVGLSVDEVTKALLEGKTATELFGKAQGAAINIGPLHLVKSATDDARNAYEDLAKTTATTAEEELNAAAKAGILTQAQVDHAVATRGAIGAYEELSPIIERHALIVEALTTKYGPLVDGSVKGAAALAAVNTESAAAGAALQGLANAGLNPSSAALVTFAIGMNNAALSSEGLDNAAITLGITTAQLTGFLNGVAGALSGFVNKVVSGLPTVADAFKPAESSAKAAGGAMAGAGRSAVDAQRQIESAQHGIVVANRGVEDSALGLQKANEGVQKSVESLTTAQQDLQDAEQALADARRGPTPKDTEQANINLERAQLAAARATEGVTKAEQDLDLARAGQGNVSIGDAELSLQDARLSSREAALRLQDAEADLQTVRQIGTEQDKNVVDAEKAVATAHDGVVDAQARVIDSQRQVVLAQRAVADSAYAAVQAEQALQTALNPPATGGGGGGGAIKRETVSIQEFITNLQGSTAKTKKFIDDIDAIFKAGGEQLSGEIAQLGVANGFTYAEQLVKSIGKDGKSALVTSAEAAVKAHNDEISKATLFLTESFGPKYIATTGLIADLASKAFGNNLSYAQKLKLELQVTAGTLSTEAASIALIAAAGGKEGADLYAKNFNISKKTEDEGLRALTAITNMPLEAPSTNKGTAVAGAFGAPITDPVTGFSGSIHSGFSGAARTIAENTGPVEGAAATGAGKVTDAFATGLDPLPGKTGDKVAAAGPSITTAAKLLAFNDATVAGGIVGAAFTQGVAFGMNNNREANQALDRAIVSLVNRIEAKTKVEADSHSPSRRFALIGKDITAGVAVGMSDTDAVIAAAEEIVAVAAKATTDAIRNADLPSLDLLAGTATGPTTVASRFTGAGFDPRTVQQTASNVNAPISIDVGPFTFAAGTTPAEAAALVAAATESAVDVVRDRQAVFTALAMAGNP